jgi:hypothetical protein
VIDDLFDRSARFYAAVLSAGSLEEWARLMSSTEVLITADETWIQQPNAQRLLVFLVNILARCIGTVTITISTAVPLRIAPVLVAPRETLVDGLRDIAVDVRGPAFAPEPPLHQLRIHVGPRPPKAATVAVAADGWRALLWGSNSAPATFTGVPNAVGAFLAALLGATAVVRAFMEVATTDDKRLAEDEELILVEGKLRERYASPLGVVQMDASDLFGIGDAGTHRDDGRDLGQIVLASVGAVNGALLFLVALAGDLRAGITGFEPQPLERSNLNRYLYALACRVATLKTLAAEALATPLVSVRAYARFVNEDLGPFAVGATVVSGADNDEARHAAQRLARGPLISLATERDQVAVSAHAKGGPCLGCLFPGGTIATADLPTHALVAGWAGLLGLLALLGRLTDRPGTELRLSALRPHDRSRVASGIRPRCPVCSGRGVLADTPDV